MRKTIVGCWRLLGNISLMDWLIGLFQASLLGALLTILAWLRDLPVGLSALIAITCCYLLLVGVQVRKSLSTYSKKQNAALDPTELSSNSPANSATTVGPPAPSTQPLAPDWPIGELFFHVDPTLRAGEGADYEETSLAIKDKLSTGQLTIWGREINFHGEARPLQKIPPDYWQHADFSYAFFFEDGKRNPDTHPDQDSGFPKYYELQVNHAQALKIWPQSIDLVADLQIWPALTKTEFGALYAALKNNKGPHSVHIVCDNAKREPLADSFATLFARLGWAYHIGSGLFDVHGARGLLLQPDNEMSRALKFAIEANTGLDIEIMNTNDSGESAAVMLIIKSATGQTEDQVSTDLWRGYSRAKFQQNPGEKAAILRLTQLRDEGVVIRNYAVAGKVNAATLEQWLNDVARWMRDVIDALKRVDEAKSEYFKTLDIVKPARVGAPVLIRNQVDAARFVNSYNQHDQRLVLLKEFLKPYLFSLMAQR